MQRYDIDINKQGGEGPCLIWSWLPGQLRPLANPQSPCHRLYSPRTLRRSGHPPPGQGAAQTGTRWAGEKPRCAHVTDRCLLSSWWLPGARLLSCCGEAAGVTAAWVQRCCRTNTESVSHPWAEVARRIRRYVQVLVRTCSAGGSTQNGGYQ